MKVGLVVERFDPLRGGLEQWTYRLAVKLAERGHEIHVVSREFSELALTLPMIPHPVRRVHSPLGFAQAAEATLAALPLDVIHDMGVGWYCDIFQPHGGSWASVTARKMLLLPPWLRQVKRGLHQVMPRYYIYRRLMARQYADHGQIMVALSRSVAADFREFHHVAPERVRIVYNGVDTECFSPRRTAPQREEMRRRLGADPHTLLLLIVAHNFLLKGVATSLRALARLRGRQLPVQLVVVGGKRLRPWRRLAARLGVGDAVQFVGPVENTLAYYAAADVYVHPTIYDTCSLVVLEAAACGLPVITTRCNGAAELFHEDRDVLLVTEPGDDAALAAKVESLLPVEARRALGDAARRTALTRTFDRNVDNIVALYREVLEQQRRLRLAGGPAVWSGRVPVRQPAVAAPRRSGGMPAPREEGVLP